MAKRAVLYARVSGDDRDNENRNLIGQLEMGREYAEKQGYEVVAELAEDDRGASGAAIDLPQLTEVRNRAAAGEIDVLVVREIDRLSRNLAKQLIVEQELRSNGVEVEYVIGEYPDTPEGRLNKHIKATIAEYEREKINERTTRALRSLARGGKVVLHGGKPPYGYRRSEDETTLVPYEPEARIVQMIFRWYTEGDERGRQLSSTKIAERLSEMQVPTWADIHGGPWQTQKKRRYGEWCWASVLRILHKDLYKGEWHYGKRHKRRGTNPREQWIAVEVPPLVSTETWEKAQEQSKRNSIMARRNTKNKYLMQGLMTCGRCGRSIGALTTRTGGKAYPYFVCYGRLNHRISVGEKCTLPYFRGDHVDAAVWDWLKSFLTEPDVLADGLKEQQAERRQANRPLRDRLSIIDDLLTDNRAGLKRALDLYLAGDFPREMLVERTQRLEETIQDLERERAELVAQVEAQTLPDEQIQTIQEFAETVARGLEAAGSDFEVQRRLVERLQVQATLAEEDSEKVMYARCVVGGKALSIASHNTSSGQA